MISTSSFPLDSSFLSSRQIKLDDRLVLTLSAASLATLPVQCEVAELGRLLPVQHQSLGLLGHLIANYEVSQDVLKLSYFQNGYFDTTIQLCS